MDRAFVDYYRCPANLVTFAHSGELTSGDCGYFCFGSNAIGYGRCSSNFPGEHSADMLHDALADVMVERGRVWLPFDPSEVVANLRYERYAAWNGDGKRLGTSSILRKAYYSVRPLLPVSVRKHLQRMHLRDWREIRFPNWPVDSNVECIFEQLMTLLLEAHAVDSVPFIWFWPDGLPSSAIMTHDVEALPGREACSRLMDLDDAWGIKSSFEIVPEGKYPVPEAFLKDIRHRGFEINVHDLDHDGRLFSNRELFLERATEINRYGRDYGAAGFRSAVLYRNVDWFEALDFAYDMSVPSVANLEAQGGGCCSITPFFIGKILELPVTTTQDYCLLHILNQSSIALWKRQIALITDQHGLASFIVHPDYVFEPRALDTYKALLAYLAGLRSEGKLWIARPREVNDWWRERSQMRLVRRGHAWEIEGPGKERARIAYASLEGNQLVYRVESPSLAVANTVNAA
ncbi:MAG: hypothetical protein DMG32_13750 [Acidobacteria bacterium]|nr:MAG: hypothetical protein DMG32_13750 [Acidobacteriota bacterium]